VLFEQARDRIGEIQGVFAPPSDINYALSTLCTYAFFIGLFVLFAGDWFFTSVFPHAGLRALVAKARENQMAAVGLLMALNYASGALIQTGAFEVYYNDDLVFSKLQTGQLPDVNYLVQQLYKRGGGSAVSAGYASAAIDE
jgi:selT/selW/selH-like putative selenoprotein